MKSILLLFICFALPTFASENYEVKSKIKNVIVYQQGAQIKRQGDYSIKKGITELVIRGVSPNIDPNTLQINATGSVTILDSKHTIFYPEPPVYNTNAIELPPKIKRDIVLLEDSLFDLSYELAGLQNRIDILNNQKRIIENNGTIKGVGKVNDSIPLLQDALKFYIQEMNAINTSLLDLSKAHFLLTKKQTRMNNRLLELQNYNSNIQQSAPTENSGPIHEIRITVSAAEAAVGRVTITYLVNNAGWTPLYDLRSTDNGGTIELTYKAQVFQNTGIDWEATPLSLSTNNPYANKTKPDLNPWYLDYYVEQYRQADQQKKSAEESQMYRAASSPGFTYDAATADAESIQALTADQFVTTVEQLLSVEYAIDLPYTIKSDNQKNMVLVKTSSLLTNYLYYTVPKLDLSVYLIAQITNLDELNLLPGKATIFHDGSYLGTTYINTAALSDTMNLSLGKTNSITVSRNLIKNASKERVVGDKILKTFAYSIDVKNLSKSTVEMIVEDQLPISRNPEIEIEVEVISKAKLDEVTGFLTWEDKIKPSGLMHYEIIYTIKYDKTKPINLAYN